jgi:hypothetical protein
MAISQAQFDSINNILKDPEQVQKLSANQLTQTRALLVEYQDNLISRNERLRAEGLNSDQIARVNAEGKDVVPNSGQDPINMHNLGTGRAKLLSPKDNAGIVDGAKRAVTGVFDLAMDISVGLNLDSEEDRQLWKNAQAEWRTEMRAAQMEEFGQLPGEVAEVAGMVVPYIFAAPASAETLTGLVAKRAVQGGVMGGSVNQIAGQSLTDRAWNMTFGSGFGVLSAVPSIASGLKKYIARDFARNFNSANVERADAVQEAVREMTGNRTFQFSIAQSTGGRFATGLETKAAGLATKEAQNTNLEILARHIFNTAEDMSGQGRAPGAIARELRETLKTARTTIYDDASTSWSNAQRNLMEEFGDDVVIRGDDYLQKIDKLLLEAEDGLQMPGGAGNKGLSNYRNIVDIEVNPVGVRQNAKGTWQLYDKKANQWLPTQGSDRRAVQAVADQQNADFGGIDADASLRIMKGLNNLIGGKSPIFAEGTAGSNREIGRALMGAFTDGLESPTANGRAVEAINGMRDAYKTQMARAQAIDDTVVGLVFGGKKLPKDPGKKLDAVLRQEPEDLASTREFLEEWNPSLLNDLRATHMERIYQGAKAGNLAAVDGEFAMGKFLKRLEGQMTGGGKAGLGLHTAKDQATIQATADALRIIKNKFFTGVQPGGPGIDDMAINLVSQSPEFMARFVSRVVSTGKSFEAGMLDQTFRKSIQTIAEEPLGSELSKAAMVLLTMWTNQHRQLEQVEAQELEQRRQQAQQAKDISRADPRMR